MLVLAGCTATQRLTCAGWVVGLAVGLLVDAAGLVLGAGLLVVAAGVALTDATTVVVFVSVVAAAAVVLEVFGVGLAWDVLAAVAVGDLLGVVVLADADADADTDAVVVVVVCAEGEGSLLAVGDFEALEVAVGELEALVVGSLVDGCGLAEVLGSAVGVGVAVGVDVAAFSGWHCWTAVLAAATAAVSSAG